MQTQLKVLDLSVYNKKWNFPLAAARGIHGCILKVSEYAIDPAFRINWPVLQASPLLAGAYHFFTPSRPADQQAQMVYNALEGGRHELGVWVDLEYNQGVNPPAENPVRYRDYPQRVWSFVQSCKALGLSVGIYTNPSTSVTFLSKSYLAPEFANLELWLANPQTGVTRTIPNCPIPFWPDSWRGWQYTWKLPNPQYYGAPPDSIKGLDASIFRW